MSEENKDKVSFIDFVKMNIGNSVSMEAAKNRTVLYDEITQKQENKMPEENVKQVDQTAEEYAWELYNRENGHKHRLFDALLQIHRIVEDAVHDMDKARYTENPLDNLNGLSRTGKLRVEMFDPRLKSAMGAPSLAEFEALKAKAKQWESMAESANQTNRAMSVHLQRLNHDMGEAIRILRLYHLKCGFLMETDKELEMSVARHPR